MRHNAKELTGQRFGRLIAIQREGKIWLCSCDCGNQTKVVTASLTLGRTRSCGCLKRETINQPRKDITNKRQGRLTAINRDPKTKLWLCYCDCGNTKNISISEFNRGRTNSCGCLRDETNTLNRAKDMTGQTFGRLTVIARDPTIKSKTFKKDAYWLCQCECGNTTTVKGHNLRKHITQSCGCYRKEMSRALLSNPTLPENISIGELKYAI